jgi:hypothetical protein
LISGIFSWISHIQSDISYIPWISHGLSHGVHVSHPIPWDIPLAIPLGIPLGIPRHIPWGIPCDIEWDIQLFISHETPHWDIQWDMGYPTGYPMRYPIGYSNIQLGIPRYGTRFSTKFGTTLCTRYGTIADPQKTIYFFVWNQIRQDSVAIVHIIVSRHCPCRISCGGKKYGCATASTKGTTTKATSKSLRTKLLCASQAHTAPLQL